MSEGVIKIEGVREHNLRNLSLEIPRGKFIVVTGVSGSGKSTLAFNVLFSEGQRRFLDSMNAYARQFVEQLPRADLDYIEGIPPSVSIEQRSTRGGGKSTVATLTEVYHFLRLLYARLGIQYCENCNIPITGESRQTLIDNVVKELGSAKDAFCFAPVLRARKGTYVELLQGLADKGNLNVRIDGEYYFLSKIPKLSRYVAHDIDVVIFSHLPKDENRLRHLLKEALIVGNGVLSIKADKGREKMFSTSRTCSQCGKAYPNLDPYDFSFNNPRGWCPECKGFGEIFYMPDVDRGAREDDIEESWFNWMEEDREVCPACGGTRLKSSARNVFLPGKWFGKGSKGPSIVELARMNVSDGASFFDKIKVTDSFSQEIVRDIFPEIKNRLSFLKKVGLDYLSLDRAIPTLSGGETQRIRLAAQLGSTLSGVLYVLDEPTIGLHARDNECLIETLKELRSRGNTMLVVEHDEDTMMAADHIIDMGPGAGIRGGEVVFQGSYAELIKDKQSLTGECLRERVFFPTRGARRKVSKSKGKNSACNWLVLKNASLHNLKNISVSFPLNRFIVVTGVSGSGKSTLVRDCLYPVLRKAIDVREGKKSSSSKQRDLEGAEWVDAVYEVDQSPIGRTARSVPATYVGFFDAIRKIFAQTPEARMRGFQPGRFSFNSVAGRCPSCAGAGLIRMSMSFMPPAFVTCETCGGKRFNPETLDVHFQEKNIDEVLQMTVAEALDFFKNHPRILKPLQALADTGLDYMKLGQGSPTLSGGEAQRVKLVAHLLGGLESKSEVSRRAIGKSRFFILEEPTIGLHASDVKRLVSVIQRLVDAGNTVLVIEHNYDLIAEADWIIDLGPEGGEGGGEIVGTGTPEDIAKTNTWTGKYLRKYLAHKMR